MQCVSHVLVLVVFNACIQEQRLLWVLQWDVNGFGASPELGSVTAACHPAQQGHICAVQRGDCDEGDLSPLCPMDTSVPGATRVSRDLGMFVKLSADSLCQE